MEKSNLKYFFIKLVAITFSIIIVINVVYNLLFAEKMEKINNFLSLDKSKFRNDLRDKVRNEIKNGAIQAFTEQFDEVSKCSSVSLYDAEMS